MILTGTKLMFEINCCDVKTNSSKNYSSISLFIQLLIALLINKIISIHRTHNIAMLYKINKQLKIIIYIFSLCKKQSHHKKQQKTFTIQIRKTCCYLYLDNIFVMLILIVIELSMLKTAYKLCIN